MQKSISYEQPLNERYRFFLRLECLFQQARHRLRGEHPWDSHASINALLEILNIIGRVDMKTEVVKELERINAVLDAIQPRPGVNTDTLNQLLTTLGGFKSQLLALDGPIGQKLRDNEFIKMLAQRSGVAGGLCDFDLPAYRHWLQRDAEVRIAQLRDWFGSLDSLRLAVELILKLIRESAVPSKCVAENGSYQQSLDPNLPFQLLRVSLPADSPYFVEISGGKHRFTVRFLLASTSVRATQASETVEFHLNCCAL